MSKKIDRFFSSMKGKKIAFCGIGKSNVKLIDMFLDAGAIITACDKKEQLDDQELVNSLAKKGVNFSLGKDYLSNLDVDIIFRTPGMPYHLKELDEAREKGIVITSEMEVFFDLCPCFIFGITGSDGKTTTTTLISEILKEDGYNVHLGGNIGKPLLPKIFDIDYNDVVVIELSSFQLISMRKSPDVAVVTNLSPNHLDVHKDMNEYITAKKNIILHQNAFSKTVLNFDNDITHSFSSSVRGKTVFFSRKKDLDTGVFINDGKIMYAQDNKREEIINVNEIVLPGLHNLENYLSAIGAVWGFVKTESIIKVARRFKGVEHRTEFVRTFNGVSYYNDSIASSPTRTISGTLSLYDRKIILIAGGYDKNIPFEALGSVIVDKVKTLILLGNTAGKIESAVKSASNFKNGNPNIIRVDCMEQAVNEAVKSARPGDIVSLSPACASFGLYKNFEERGRHFKSLVNELS